MTSGWKSRDRKQRKKKSGMRISGRSVFTLQEEIRKREEKLRERKHKDRDSGEGDR